MHLKKVDFSLAWLCINLTSVRDDCQVKLRVRLIVTRQNAAWDDRWWVSAYPKPFELSECNGRDIWGVSSSSSASWLNACVGRSEWSLHLSPEQSLASIRAASGGASATEWEQNRPDCVRREALARDQLHLKPPLILQCAVELLYCPNTTPNTCLARLLDWELPISVWAVQTVRHAAFMIKYWA